MIYHIPGVYVDQVPNNELPSTEAETQQTFIIGTCRNYVNVKDAQIIAAGANTIRQSSVIPYVGSSEIPQVGQNVKLISTYNFTTLLGQSLTQDLTNYIQTDIIGTKYIEVVEGVPTGPLLDSPSGTTKQVIANDDVEGISVEGAILLSVILQATHESSIDEYLVSKLEGSSSPKITRIVDEVYDVIGSGDEIKDSDLLIVTSSYFSAHPSAYTDSDDGITIVLDNTTTSSSDYLLDKEGNKIFTSNYNGSLTIGEVPGFYNLTAGVDYNIDTESSNYVIIDWVVGKPLGSSFYASFKVLRQDYNPKLYLNTQQIIEDFGNPLEDGVVNPLSLAGTLCLKGQTSTGAGVWLSPVEADTEFAYKEKIDQSTNFSTPSSIIILKQESLNLRNYLISNIMANSSLTMSQFRTTMITADDTVDDYDYTTMAAQRSGLNNKRVVYWANKKMLYTLDDTVRQETVQKTLSSIYAICYVSGLEGNPNYIFAEPMLNKQLDSSIQIDPNEVLNPSIFTYLGSNSLSYFDTNINTGITKIKDIVNTSSNNVVEATRTATRVNDMISKTLIKNHYNKFVAKLITPELPQSIAKATETILDNFKKVNEIYAWRNISVATDTSDPRMLRLGCEIRNSYECKWIFISIGFYI